LIFFTESSKDFAPVSTGTAPATRIIGRMPAAYVENRKKREEAGVREERWIEGGTNGSDLHQNSN
jgi:hypothetical protein